MKACGERLGQLSMAELEATAAGRVECEECEVEVAQLMLAHHRRRGEVERLRERNQELEGQVRDLAALCRGLP